MIYIPIKVYCKRCGGEVEPTTGGFYYCPYCHYHGDMWLENKIKEQSNDPSKT